MVSVSGDSVKRRFYVPFILAFLVFSAVLTGEYFIISQAIEDAYKKRSAEYHSFSSSIISIIERFPHIPADSLLKVMQPLLPYDSSGISISRDIPAVPNTEEIPLYNADGTVMDRRNADGSWENLVIEHIVIKTESDSVLCVYLVNETDGHINFLHDAKLGLIIIQLIIIIILMVPSGLMIESFRRRRRMTGLETVKGSGAVQESVLGSLKKSNQAGVMVLQSGGKILWINDFCLDILEISEAESRSGISSVMALPPGIRESLALSDDEYSAHSGSLQVVLKSMTGEMKPVIMEVLFSEEKQADRLKTVTLIPAGLVVRSNQYRKESVTAGANPVLLKPDTKMLGSIIHRMRNHLSGIVGMASLELEGGISEISHESLVSILDSAGKLTAICEDIELLFNREGESKLRDPLNEVSLISNILKRILPKGVDFQVSGGSRKLISTSRVLLREFLYSLAVNSADTMNGKGRIRIDVSDRIPAELGGMGIFSPDSMVAVRYSDGFIMPVALRDVLSSRKYTDSDVERQFGTAIGTLYRVIREMKGRIVFERSSGETQLCLLLQGTEQEVSAQNASVCDTADLKVLVADENKSLLKSACDFLEYRGIVVTPVSDDSRAVNLIKSGVFDAVVLDMNIFGTAVDGIVRFCQTSLSKMAVIITTEHGITASIRELLDCPSTAYINKPYKLEIMLETIYSILVRIRKVNEA